MNNRRLLHCGLTAFLGLSLALGLGFSLCPTGLMAAGGEKGHCTETPGEDRGACAHALFAASSWGLCADAGAAICVEEAITHRYPYPELGGSAGPISTVEGSLSFPAPVTSSLQPRRRGRPATSSVALHLLYDVWLN